MAVLLFGDKLKKIRLDRNMSQEELGEFLGTSKQVISRYETNQRTPKITTVEEYAKKLNIPLEYLINNSVLDIKEVTATKDTIPVFSVKSRTKLPIIGTVTAGPDGPAYADPIGEEWTDTEDLHNGSTYYWFQIKGDSMIGEGIMPGDFALIREQPDIECGQLAIVVVNGEEGTLKRVYKKADSVILQSANAKYPPRIFSKNDINTIRIIGRVIETKRKY